MKIEEKLEWYKAYQSGRSPLEGIYWHWEQKILEAERIIGEKSRN
jgi:hypothetical protein